MNEIIVVIAIWTLTVVTLIAIVVKLFFNAYKDDEYIDKNDYIFDDFYLLSKGSRDEDSW